MRIIISDVHQDLKKGDSNDISNRIGEEVSEVLYIGLSGHKQGSVAFVSDNKFYSGVYVTCVDNEGCPI